MKLILIFLSFFTVFAAVAFEGIVHCTQTQNGMVTTFDFYVKGNQIAIVSNAPEGNYKILISSSREEVKICMDSPLFENKGYYVLTRSNVENKQSPEIYRKIQTGSLTIDGKQYEGYTLASEIGTAIAYIGSEDINLSGLSAFFNDPLYELLDAFGIKTLPGKIIVSKTTGTYTIDLTATETTLDSSIFEVPEGMKQFQVTLE